MADHYFLNVIARCHIVEGEPAEQTTAAMVDAEAGRMAYDSDSTEQGVHQSYDFPRSKAGLDDALAMLRRLSREFDLDSWWVWDSERLDMAPRDVVDQVVANNY